MRADPWSLSPRCDNVTVRMADVPWVASVWEASVLAAALVDVMGFGSASAVSFFGLGAL